jgi:hypothetical protein
MQQPLIYDRKLIPKSAFQLLYCVWAMPVQKFLEVSLLKKSGTVRSYDRRGHWITDN